METTEQRPSAPDSAHLRKLSLGCRSGYRSREEMETTERAALAPFAQKIWRFGAADNIRSPAMRIARNFNAIVRGSFIREHSADWNTKRKCF